LSGWDIKLADMLPTPHPRVVCQPVAEGGVLLNTEGEVYFGLNAVALRIWQLLPPSSPTLDELCASLAAAYPDAASEQLRQDVLELLDQLREQGLVVDRAAAP
jgi:hypothetical protein